MAHILLVDDEPGVLNILTRMLTVAGHQSTAVDRGDTAIEKLRQSSFDLVISDVRMSPVDGMTVLSAARRLKPEMPIIMLTAYSCDDTRQRAMRSGAYAYMMKPFRMKEVLDAIENALDKSVADDNPDV